MGRTTKPKPHLAPVAPPTRGQSAEAADDEARRRAIAERAYYRAEARGFAPGAELDDWLAAEREETVEEAPETQFTG